jgi:peptidyl-prolyl cis-trans isomerase A (cyclophilin A)
MLRLTLVTVTVVLAVAASAAAAPPPSLNHPASVTGKAPVLSSVTCTTPKRKFVFTQQRALAPRGADRFYNLVRAKFFDGVTFFRVVKGFVVQFGISPTPAIYAAWETGMIREDAVKSL